MKIFQIRQLLQIKRPKKAKKVPENVKNVFFLDSLTQILSYEKLYLFESNIDQAEGYHMPGTGSNSIWSSFLHL